jgi:hypothetical protein
MSVDADGLQARIEHETAELRGAFPALQSCQSALVHWAEGGEARYSLGLDIRAPRHQTLVSGPEQPTPEAAVEAAFRSARERLRRRFA